MEISGKLDKLGKLNNHDKVSKSYILCKSNKQDTPGKLDKPGKRKNGWINKIGKSNKHDTPSKLDKPGKLDKPVNLWNV